MGGNSILPKSHGWYPLFSSSNVFLYEVVHVTCAEDGKYNSHSASRYVLVSAHNSSLIRSPMCLTVDAKLTSFF